MKKSIALCLATHNGQIHLDEQLQSLAEQSVNEVHVLARDDGSTDDTYEILKHWQSKWSKGFFKCHRGEQLGFADNYRWLIRNQNFDADYYGFCDQDDVWRPMKLARAVQALEATAQTEPGLYGSRTRMFYQTPPGHQYSPLFRKPPHFKNALVQSLVGGNTMIMNKKAWTLYKLSVERTPFVSHDWWGYLIITGAGGIFHYDPQPHIDYRQHDGNQVGANVSLKARLKRIQYVLTGGWSRWTDLNISGLQKNSDLLSPEAKELLQKFETMRNSHPIAAIQIFRNSGFYRQSTLGTLSMILAILLGRL